MSAKHNPAFVLSQPRPAIDSVSLYRDSDAGADMARRRLQVKGHLYRDGAWWRFRWYEDVIDEAGRVKRGRPSAVVARCSGPGAVTEKQARRLTWEILARIDTQVICPQSIMTVADFVERFFKPGHVMLKKRAGQIHYATMLAHILPVLGKKRICDVSHADVQNLVSDKLGERYSIGKEHPRTGTYSVQMARHLRNVVSAIFEHAKRNRMYAGENPARYVKLPEMERREKHALTWEQMEELLDRLPSPAREVALFAVLTSMNISELCGLQWKRVNLTAEWVTVDGEALPPWTIAVRRQWYRNAYGTLKTPSRRRFLPISPLMAEELNRLRARPQFAGPDDPVFASRTGRPMDEHNTAKRTLKPIGKELGMPWLSWHAFRRTHATLSDQVEMSGGDRVAMMGHSSLKMTSSYTVVDLDRRRAIIERMGERLLRKPVARELGAMPAISEKAQ